MIVRPVPVVVVIVGVPPPCGFVLTDRANVQLKAESGTVRQFVTVNVREVPDIQVKALLLDVTDGTPLFIGLRKILTHVSE